MTADDESGEKPGADGSECAFPHPPLAIGSLRIPDTKGWGKGCAPYVKKRKR